MEGGGNGGELEFLQVVGIYVFFDAQGGGNFLFSRGLLGNQGEQQGGQGLYKSCSSFIALRGLRQHLQ